MERPRVLVVDVDPATPNVLAEVLGTRFHFSTAASPSRPPPGDLFDLVLADIASPGLGVWSAKAPRTPLIAIVPRNNIQVVISAMKLGANDCVQRPFDADELRNAVAAQLDAPGDAACPRVAGRQVHLPHDMSLAELEDICIRQALEYHGGSTSRAAASLGISTRTLQRKRKQWRLAATRANSSPTSAPPSGTGHHGSMAQVAW